MQDTPTVVVQLGEATSARDAAYEAEISKLNVELAEAKALDTNKEAEISKLNVELAEANAEIL